MVTVRSTGVYAEVRKRGPPQNWGEGYPESRAYTQRSKVVHTIMGQEKGTYLILGGLSDTTEYLPRSNGYLCLDGSGNRGPPQYWSCGYPHSTAYIQWSKVFHAMMGQEKETFSVLGGLPESGLVDIYAWMGQEMEDLLNIRCMACFGRTLYIM